MTPQVLADAAPEIERDAATKAAVLATAERLFAEQGLRAVSVRDITAAAGVNLASVNYHFGSKDALVFGAGQTTAPGHRPPCRIAAGARYP